MNARNARRFPSNIVNACIIAFAIVAGASILSSRGQNTAQQPPSEASVRAQFISQVQAQTSGRQFFVHAEPHSVDRIEIDRVNFAADCKSFHIVYAIQWKPTATTVTGCSLNRDGYGHFTNAHDAASFGDAGTPLHISIQ